MKNTFNSSFFRAIGWPKETAEFYDSCGFVLTDFKEEEGAAYQACSFTLNGGTIIGRTAKQTPKKIGQFVAIWKRTEARQTAPFREQDRVDFLVINVISEFGGGQFVFPKSVLVDQGIISSAKKPGKRGIRVYPPWDHPTSKQAQNTQQWQLQYFLELSQQSPIAVEKFKMAYQNNHR